MVDLARFDDRLASAVIEAEARRALERLFRDGELTAEQMNERQAKIFEALDRYDLVDVDRAIIRRAAQPFGAAIATLDAIHLATALLWSASAPETPLVFATHDEALALAARAQGLEIEGV